MSYPVVVNDKPIKHYPIGLLLAFPGIHIITVILIPPPLHFNLRIRQLILPRREHLHRARLELRDQCLRVERVVRQQVRGGFGEVPRDKHHTHRRRLGDGGAQNNFAAA